MARNDVGAARPEQNGIDQDADLEANHEADLDLDPRPDTPDDVPLVRADEVNPAAPPTRGESVAEPLARIGAQLAELVRLRAADIDLADRLYAENTRLRAGEYAAAVAPLLSGLLRLQDQMTSLASGDVTSDGWMLRTQLLQILDTAAGICPFEPAPGERFDTTRHAGAGRAPTTDPDAEGTVARTLKPGFARADGSIVRVAHVEVYRFASH